MLLIRKNIGLSVESGFLARANILDALYHKCYILNVDNKAATKCEAGWRFGCVKPRYDARRINGNFTLLMDGSSEIVSRVTEAVDN